MDKNNLLKKFKWALFFSIVYCGISILSYRFVLMRLRYSDMAGIWDTIFSLVNSIPGLIVDVDSPPGMMIHEFRVLLVFGTTLYFILGLLIDIFGRLHKNLHPFSFIEISLIIFVFLLLIGSWILLNYSSKLTAFGIAKKNLSWCWLAYPQKEVCEFYIIAENNNITKCEEFYKYYDIKFCRQDILDKYRNSTSHYGNG